MSKKPFEDGQPVPTLCELAARCVASHIPFELVEHFYPPVPEQLQLRIAFWSFPDNEEDIRLYSCLANGSADEFLRGEHLFRSRSVKEPLQIGFHLNASVNPQMVPNGVRPQFNVAVTFDRRKITSCNCTCSSTAYWCAHVVAVCLHRIHMPTQVCLRAPVSESLSRLHREQLQKFAQYLISELPQQILPTAQRLLDELLSMQPSAINIYCGAPDPTAGASAHDQTSWYLDEKTLHDNIKKILIKFCVPAPIVFSDVNYLSTTAPPAAAEWASLLRPLRGREPEGMWNLLSIVREMFKRNDRNAIPLLEIITEECMACEQILVWWFNTKVALLNGTGYGGKHNMNSNVHASQHACSSLCDEIVVLWRLASLNPGLSPAEREMLHAQFMTWHLKIIDKVTKSRGSSVSHNSHNRNGGMQKDSLKHDVAVFTGFKPALEACYLDWDEYILPGITYTAGSNPMYHCPFTCFRHAGDTRTEVNQVNSSSAVLNYQPPISHHHSRRPLHVGLVEFSYLDRRRLNPREFSMCSRNAGGGGDGNRSSVSSEGFCENDTDIPDLAETQVVLVSQDCAQLNNCGDTDSQEGGGSESSSNSNVSLKDAQGSDNARSNASSETNSDSNDSSNNKATCEVKCSRMNLPENRDKSRAHVSKNATAKSEQESDQEKEARRPFKDESSSSSSDSPSGDEYHVYYYDPKTVTSKSSGLQSKYVKSNTHTTTTPDASTVLDNLKKIEDPWDILFSRAEGLYAHGHTREACILGVQLAEELLAHPPDLMIEGPPVPVKSKRKKQHVNPASHQVTCLASATLGKCGFLCTVLAENPEHHNLAFRVGLFGLEMARPPANTKPLEVKLAHQESELVILLKRIPLGPEELAMIRQRAEQLRDGVMRSRGHALLPIMLASFIYDALDVPRVKLPAEVDPNLGFDAAVAVLGLKANVSEADHPLLCEGTRRQRGELAITLLVHYKDDPVKLARIMDKLLDRDVHQLIKSPILSSYYTSNPPTKSEMSRCVHEEERSSPLTGTDNGGNADNIVGGSSRPHSSTSAEIESGMSALTVQPQIVQPSVPTIRTKETRYKSKRVYPSIPNQPSEAGAHFMCELAKTVLAKAGGTSSTSLFHQPSTSQNHHGPHRALHMCAFQLGLYSLGLHNCVSPNWLSRTYSSHVSWITGQAMEIGAPAIWFLIDSWEGHLTPPEAASIADKSSRGSDPNMVRAAAELALSCLPHAHALNPNEIQRAISQCKEQSEAMLEKACVTVENTAKGGGVYPEVLFQVAKYWYELFLRRNPGGDQQDEVPHDPLQLDLNGVLLVEPGPPVDMPNNQMMSGPNQAVVATSTQPQPQPYSTHPTITTLGVGMPYAVGPFSFVHPHHSIATYNGPMPSHHVTLPPAPPHMQMYHAFPPHPGHPQHPQHPQQHPQHSPHPHHPPSPVPPPPGPQYYTAQPPPTAGNHHLYPIPVNVQTGVAGPLSGQNTLSGPPLVQTQPIISTVRTQPQVHRQNQPFSQQHLRTLVSAYRVGMLALETLARRVHDDRPQAKYARNPPYGEDVKFLLRVAKRLGTQYMHQLCICAVNSIVSPFVLHHVALEAAQYLARNNPALILQHLRSALLAPLVHKCQQMYIQCMHQKLYHLTASDYEEFASVVCAARAAFQINPEGNTQFKEWLQSIKRSQSCNKELWAQINAALQQTGK